jgi:L-lactate utilization protein LutC
MTLISDQATDRAVETRFARLPSGERIERTVRALEENGIRVRTAATGAEARQIALELIPEGAEVHQGSSTTLERIGLSDELTKSGRYEPLRPQIFSMDRKTQMRDIRKLGAAPDYMLGSAHAVTEGGSLVVASASGSQLGPYAYAAGKVILVVGAQKIVADLDEAMERIEEYTFPLEDARARETYGFGSGINKVLIINRERQADRITVILVDEILGF